jgi:hypothetical protein
MVEMSASTAAPWKYGFKYDHSQGYRDFSHLRKGRRQLTLIDYSTG